MPLVAILALAAGTYLLRLVGPVFHDRVSIPDRVQGILTAAAIVLLFALVVTSAVTAGEEFAGWARPAGVLVGGALALRKAPFPVVVIAAAVTTAVLRLLGVP